MGGNSRAANLPADKKYNHSYRAKRTARHEDEKYFIGWTFRFSHFFALSPISTRRRMASERVVSFCAAHASTVATVASGIRDDTMTPRPVAGRPRPFFWSTFIDFFMN
jgi:hypothetical protein